MIIGIGTDIVNIERIGAVFQKYGNEFLTKNFHQLEIDKFHTLPEKQQVAFLARRFAAKESILKALGTGMGAGLALCDLAIVNDELGAPKLVISPEKKSQIDNKYNIHISLSDDHPFAVAFTVISG